MFNRRKWFKVIGVIGLSILLIFSSAAMAAPSSLQTGSRGGKAVLLKRGMEGPAVKELQQKLKTKGFYPSAVDGDFGLLTERAVKDFQKSLGIRVDGIVGPETAARLKSSSTPSRSASIFLRRTFSNILSRTTASKPSDASLSTSSDISTSRSSRKSSDIVRGLISWSRADKLFPRKSKAWVTDVETGKSFTVYRMGGNLHADVEPLTAKDTAALKSIYGGKWSWARRAVIVQVQGIQLAASMNGMPHGQQTIFNNDFNGQFCIHFLGSAVHQSRRIDPDHQAMIRKAATYIGQ